METKPVQIGAEGIDTEAVVADILQRVKANREAGLYEDPRVARAEFHNLRNLQDDERFLEIFLDCMQESSFVDINDFEIVERRRLGSGALVRLKTLIWSTLRFYTYRLWSQQNRINGEFLTAIEMMTSRSRERIDELEKRVAELEGEKQADA